MNEGKSAVDFIEKGIAHVQYEQALLDQLLNCSGLPELFVISSARISSGGRGRWSIESSRKISEISHGSLRLKTLPPCLSFVDPRVVSSSSLMVR
jgi:hypothetical protein